MGSNGGNITIGTQQSQFVIVQNSNISANANQGAGGNVLLQGNVVLVDAQSRITASSAFGISGTVRIISPLQNISQALAPLQEDFTEASTLYAAKCAADKEGSFSSFVQTGRDGIPPEPHQLLESPLLDGDLSFTPLSPESKIGSHLAAARLGLNTIPISHVVFSTESSDWSGCQS